MLTQVTNGTDASVAPAEPTAVDAVIAEDDFETLRVHLTEGVPTCVGTTSRDGTFVEEYLIRLDRGDEFIVEVKRPAGMFRPTTHVPLLVAIELGRLANRYREALSPV